MTINRESFPTFEEFFEQKEEQFYKERPELKEHPELDVIDGISGKKYRKDNAKFEYGMMQAMNETHLNEAAKEAEELKQEYERNLKEIKQAHNIEQSATDKAMLELCKVCDQPGDFKFAASEAYWKSIGMM